MNKILTLGLTSLCVGFAFLVVMFLITKTFMALLPENALMITLRERSLAIEASAWLQRVHSSVFLTIPEDGALNQTDEEDRRNAVGVRLQVSRSLGTGDLSATNDSGEARALEDYLREVAAAVGYE